MGSRFVRPDTTRLTISDGDWLLVKRRLTSGEQRAAYARMYLPGLDGRLKVNPLQTGVALITAYLLDWSLVDADGAVVAIQNQPIDALISALDALDQESFTEILHAIEAHETAMLSEREQEKKRLAGANGSSAISQSPVDSAGGMSGLLN